MAESGDFEMADFFGLFRGIGRSLGESAIFFRNRTEFHYQ